MVYKCRVCGVDLDEKNWYASRQKQGSCICKKCQTERESLWRKANPDKVEIYRRNRGQISMSENKECSAYLGVHIAEQVLRYTFNDVETMPYGNRGYDFICNKGKKIDVKSSCLNKVGGWGFRIERNIIADYFLCLAFDSRADLNPLHLWMIPGWKFSRFVHTTICPSTIHKWDAYKLDVEGVSLCCDVMRNEKFR